MTRKVGNTVFLEPTAPAECEFCHKIDELRPYGPNNESICFDCAMKDEATAMRKFNELVDGPGEKPQMRRANRAEAERDAIRAKTIEECTSVKATIPQKAFAIGENAYLEGFQDGAAAQIDAIRALNQPEAGGGERGE